MEMEKSYVEIKVSFIHIVVLLAGVLVIGVFLFYLGYQAGKSSVHTEMQASNNAQSAAKTEELKLPEDTEKSKKKETPKQQEASISDEIRLHQLPTTTTATTTSPKEEKKTAQNEQKELKEQVKSKPAVKESYFVIQVGAFADYSNAQKYSTRFATAGYPTEIDTSENNGKKLFKVRVGNFKSRADAQKNCDKLQKNEKKKFAIVFIGSE
jgi:cell division protein FtsN